MKHKTTFGCFLLFMFSICFSSILGTLRAQGPVGTINGTILDATGAVVPGATVVATNVATGVESKTTSTTAGAYTLPYLPAGTYTIRVSASSFRTSTAENVILRVAQDLTVNIALQIGQVNEQVTVSDQPPLIDAGTAEIGRYISIEEYKSWPILVDDGQRQIQSFIFSSLPGTTGDTFQGSINGGQEYSHEILIEGIPIGRSDLSGGNNNEFSPSAEAVSEFKLQTGTISAQYNGGQTAVANFNIKSGTNNLHGSAFYYNQNEFFNANNLENAGNKKSKHREDNYGYSVGGPVYIPKVYNGRHKTFFFTNFEKTKENNLVFSGSRTTLAPVAFKQGDFSRLLDPNYTGNPLSGTQVSTCAPIDPTTGKGSPCFDALGRPVIFGQIYDPSTTRTVNGSVVRDPFPGNIIPDTAWDPVAKNVIQNVGIVDPLFDTMTRNTPKIGTCCPFFQLHIFGVKLDHEITQKHKISGYYNRSYRDRNNNGSARYLPIPGPPTSSWQEQKTPGNMVRLALSSTLTPTLMNRVAAGYNRFRNENGAPPETLNQDWATKIGMSNLPGTMFPVFRFSGASYQGGTIGRMGVGFTDDAPNGSYIYTDDLTWIRGKHSFRFGYQYSRYFYNDKSLSDAGSFTFGPRATDLPGFADSTGHSFASFLLGGVQSANHVITPFSQGFRQPQHAFYAADDWKLTPKLTVNAGLRWEIIPPFFEVTGRMSEISLSTPNPGANGRPGALVFANGGSRFNDTYWKEFGPRLGLAYQVNNKLAVRAGYAMTNTPPIRNDWGYGGFTLGFNGQVNVAQGTSPTGFVDDPSIYLSQPYPSLQGSLPNTDPAQLNYDGPWTTTARNANRPGYVQNYSLTVQYLLPQQTVLEVAFVGNKGTRLWGGVGSFSEFDGLPASRLSLGDVLIDSVANNPQYLPYASFPTDRSVAQALRPFPQYLGVEEAFPYNQSSNYNSLQITATRHLTKGLGFLAAYTFSKAIGYVDGNGPGAAAGCGCADQGIQDFFNPRLERSVTGFNHPQDFKLTWVYESPVGKGNRFDLKWGNWIVGGWQLSAVHNYGSGDAINIVDGSLTIPDGFAPGIRPDIVPGQPLTLGGAPTNVQVSTGTPYLNPAAFASVPHTANGVPLRVGTAPRFLPNVRGPHSMSEIFRMNKKFPITKREGTFFGIGMTMTNPFKRIDRFIGTADVSDSAFGQVFAGGGGRTIQLDGRIEF
ncbi:MAG TPA: TonB-dependent receptor [Candidatus Bathyarchaeia archaeon]|nr:TonB-dependent receptor [Candidatus Bathyarchaeia archaeon]